MKDKRVADVDRPRSSVSPYIPGESGEFGEISEIGDGGESGDRQASGVWGESGEPYR